MKKSQICTAVWTTLLVLIPGVTARAAIILDVENVQGISSSSAHGINNAKTQSAIAMLCSSLRPRCLLYQGSLSSRLFPTSAKLSENGDRALGD